jgi:sigma-B regulation protein RsbQ
MGNPDQPQLALYFAAKLKAIPAGNALTVLCTILQSDQRPDIARLSQPTLLIQSRDDVAVPMEVAEYLHREIPRSRLEVVEATGHLPHVSAPAVVRAALPPFVPEEPAG